MKKLQSPTTFLNYFFILVPPELLIADAKVITTSDTPAFIASKKEFSNLGIIPPLNNAISYILFKFGTGDLGNHTVIIILVTQHAFLLKTIYQYHIKQGRQRFRCLPQQWYLHSYSAYCRIVVRQWSHHRNNAFMYQIRQ